MLGRTGTSGVLWSPPRTSRRYVNLLPPDSTSAAASKTQEQQRRYHISILQKVVDEAGFIVLNVRDLAGCRLVKEHAGAKRRANDLFCAQQSR